MKMGELFLLKLLLLPAFNTSRLPGPSLDDFFLGLGFWIDDGNNVNSPNSSEDKK